MCLRYSFLGKKRGVNCNILLMLYMHVHVTVLIGILFIITASSFLRYNAKMFVVFLFTFFPFINSIRYLFNYRLFWWSKLFCFLLLIHWYRIIHFLRGDMMGINFCSRFFSNFPVERNYRKNICYQQQLHIVFNLFW